MTRGELTGSQLMLEAAGAARHELDGSACRSIAGFVAGHVEPDGGFRGRGKGSDLYYSVFGSGCLLALDDGFDFPRFLEYVSGSGDGDGLDFVHLCCLARCLSIVPDLTAGQCDARVIERISAYRTRDGGFNQRGVGLATGSAYAAFLAMLAYEDLGEDLCDTAKMLDGLSVLRSEDGGYGNAPGMREGTTTAATAALFLQHRLGTIVDEGCVEWLQARFRDRGGVVASSSALLPDILSTATTVFTLTMLGADLSNAAERTVEWVEMSWNDDGGFGAGPMDESSDCEYTFYALMTLGLLAGGQAS